MSTNGLESHHTPEEITAAFQTAPIILKELRDLGIPGCSFRLFEDASGKLIVPPDLLVTAKTADKVYNLIFSRRISMNPHEPGLDFCCGLVQAAKARGILA